MAVSSLRWGSLTTTAAACFLGGSGVLGLFAGSLFRVGLVASSWASKLVARFEQRGPGFCLGIGFSVGTGSSLLVAVERSGRIGGVGEGSRGTHTVLRRRVIRGGRATISEEM